MTQTEAPKRQHNVNRTFDVYDELPPLAPKASVLETSLETVKATAPGKYVCIAEYTTPAAASGAATNLRRRHGSDPTVDGWTFVSRKIGDKRHGLLVHYDGAKIVKGKLAEVEKTYNEWKKEQAAKAKAAAAKKAKAKAEAVSVKK